MMDAGLVLLSEGGIGVGAGELTFKKVFDGMEATAGVRLTNASVIRRVWENQAAFRDDVLTAVALAGDGGSDTDRTGSSMLSVVEAIDVSSPEGRRAGLSEACRVAGAASLRGRTGSRSWSLWVGVWVLAVTSPPSARCGRIRRALLEGYEATTDHWEELHGALLDFLGYRVRAPFTLRQFTVAVRASSRATPCATAPTAGPA